MAPVETKVTAATAAAAASAFVAWVLRAYVFHGDLPPEVEVFVDMLVVTASTFAAGWLAKHTPRADPDAQPMPAPYVGFDDPPDDGRHRRRDP